eukprot:TRINITY_DN95118_c0_g1_i1.p1 TRINITY_DN95118_c0_g1~~TRINITY_DN95118_c0_g1_i1.p1  ORF type:complete len:384 (-),score=48.45 TRINITY_DN95118_c0_g1_i1:90-1241(-)
MSCEYCQTDADSCCCFSPWAYRCLDEEQVPALLDKLVDNRKKTPLIPTLKQLYAVAQTRGLSPELFAKYSFTLLEALRKIIRGSHRSATVECRVLACRVASCLLLQGVHQEDKCFCEDLLRLVQDPASAKPDNEPLLLAALETLSWAALVLKDDAEFGEDTILEEVQKVLVKRLDCTDNNNVTHKVLQCLCITGLPYSVDSEEYEEALSVIQSLLYSDNSDVVVNAAKLLALVVDDTGDDNDDVKDQSWYTEALSVLQAEMQLSSVKFTNQKARKQQRKALRELQDTEPCKTVRLGGKKVELQGWGMILMYEALVRVFGGYLGAHTACHEQLLDIQQQPTSLSEQKLERHAAIEQHAQASKKDTKYRNKVRRQQLMQLWSEWE